MKKLLLVFVFTIYLISVKSQNLTDTIVTNKSDTIICNIKLVNDYNIFYEYKKKKKIKSDFISKDAVLYYHSSDCKKITYKYEINEVVFYGYDFSHFKLNDIKRMNQNITSFTSVWTSYINGIINEEELKKLMTLGSVTFKTEFTNEVNKTLDPYKLATSEPYTINKDSIQSYINSYPLDNNNGIGFVIIYECFSEPNKTISAYYVFFDLKTREIVQNDYFKYKADYSYNKVTHWGKTIHEALYSYTKQFDFENN